MNIVIIGLGTGAFAALLSIKKYNKDASITVIDKKPFNLQHTCGLPYALEGKISLEGLEHSIDAEKMGIKVINNAEATKIDRENKEVVYVFEGKEEKISYDKLILDLGGKSFMPPIEGVENALTLHTSNDIREIRKQVKKGGNAVVIGAGAIGMEGAYALYNLGMKVTIIEAMDYLFPRAIDKDVSLVLQKYLEEKEIKIHLNERIEKIEDNKVITDKESHDYDVLICATGVRPNTELASSSGIKTSEFGIVVNEKMQTDDENIYAVGDCVQAKNKITGEFFESQLATTAYHAGSVCGDVISGKDSSYKGSVTTFASVVGKVELACTGLNSHYAKQNGYEVVIGKAISVDLPEWFGESGKIVLKILASKDGKILGAQAIGRNASSRINVISCAINCGMTLKDLRDVELCYCPPLAQTYDVLHQAVDIGLRKLG